MLILYLLQVYFTMNTPTCT